MSPARHNHHSSSWQQAKPEVGASKVPLGRWESVLKIESKVTLPVQIPARSVIPPPPTNAYKGGGRNYSAYNSQLPSTILAGAPDSTLVKFVSNVSIALRGSEMTAVDIPHLIQIMGDQLFNSQSLDVVYFISLDLSDNRLSCEAIQTIADWFLAHSAHARLRNLKVFRNAVGDSGATALASLIHAQCTAVEELHLSHNEITSAGAAVLFKAFAEACKQDGSFTYPRYDYIRGIQLPVWIRLEYNRVMEGNQLLEKWEAECRAARKIKDRYSLFCNADRPAQHRDNKDPHCSPSRCIKASDCFSPLLHVYSFYHQAPPVKCESPRNQKATVEQAKLPSSRVDPAVAPRGKPAEVKQGDAGKPAKVKPERGVDRAEPTSPVETPQPVEPEEAARSVQAASPPAWESNVLSPTWTDSAILDVGRARRMLPHSRVAHLPPAHLSPHHSPYRHPEGHRRTEEDGRMFSPAQPDGRRRDPYHNSFKELGGHQLHHPPFSTSYENQASQNFDSATRPPAFHLPLYIFLDASAFSEMRLAHRKEKLNLFSFPVIFSLCQKKTVLP